MGEYELQIDSEFDFVGVSFDGNAVVSENRHLKLAVLPTELRVHSWRYRRVKRFIDIAGALLMLALCLVPGLLIAAAVALTSRGPIFYREVRIGRDGKPFRIWKFRSMRAKSELQESLSPRGASGVLLHWRIHKVQHDPRITPVGGFLRRWSLDELPQVFNVLRGDMSLIGPRPVIEAEVQLYGQLRHYYLAATPGLSGLWQVSGRSNVNFAARANLDATYVRNWSLLTDVAILCRTLPAVLGRVGAR
jgi:exopolysaccharide production protein ExoY